MTPGFFGEFMGTLVLVMLGNCNVANVVLKKSKAEGSGWMVICTGWALAVMLGVFVAIACGSAGAHINPAVTVAFAVRTGDWSNVGPFIVAQLLGAFCGAVLAWLHFLPHWAETKDAGLKLAVFSTGNRPRSAARSDVCPAWRDVCCPAYLVSSTYTLYSVASATPGGRSATWTGTSPVRWSSARSMASTNARALHEERAARAIGTPVTWSFTCGGSPGTK